MPHWLANFPRWPTLLFAIVNAAIASTIAARLWQGSQAHSILETAARPIAMPEPLRDLAPSAIDPTVIQSAALFYESRSFYVPPAAPVLQTRPDYRLSATLTIPGQPPFAMLVQNQSGAKIKVRVGDDLEGWTVDAIQARAVLLRHEQQQLEIRSSQREPGMQPLSSTRP